MFRNGDKIVCVYNLGHEFELTKNKLYTVLATDESTDDIVITNNLNENYWYQENFFISLKDLRKRKIKDFLE